MLRSNSTQILLDAVRQGLGVGPLHCLLARSDLIGIFADPTKLSVEEFADAWFGAETQATLKGLQFNSFGAFFSRAYRENDYLWGRLHGADRLIDITLSTLPNEADCSSLDPALGSST